VTLTCVLSALAGNLVALRLNLGKKNHALM